jgi:RNA polymerase sigma factor (sigma-70 family)
MPSPESVTTWIGQLNAGNPEAAQQLWERYFHRLVGLARKKLQGIPRLGQDGEDVALSAFDSFVRGAARGAFPQLTDRDNLWKLLVTITARKAYDLVRDEHRQRRGGGAVQGESALIGPPGSEDAAQGIDAIVGRDPTPEFAAQVAEEYQHLMATLANPELQAVAQAKLEGYTNKEIAAKLEMSLRGVERRLKLIRHTLEKELAA